MSPAPCAKCSSPLGRSAPDGLCAHCMLAAGLSEAMSWPKEEGAEEPAGQANESGTARGRFGRYELLEEIGRGGMGIVYRARDVTLQRVVALKMILSGQFASKREKDRFRAEAEASARLDHPNIVPIYEVGEQDGRSFYSMKLMERGALAAQAPLSNHQAAILLAKIAHAVHHAHQRAIIHRDLKPGNILLDAQGEPHVSDFGLAKCLEASTRLTLSGVVIGSPSYMPPEQATGHSERLTTAADVYSLGALFYHLLTQRPPFEGETHLAIMEQVVRDDPSPPRAICPQTNPDLETICLKCLAKEPQRRYASADALAADLERFLRHEPIQARPIQPMERLTKWIRRNPRVASLLLTLTLVLVIGLSGILTMNVRLASANRAKDRAHARVEKQVRDLQWQKIDELIASGKRGDALAYLSHLLRLNPHDHAAATRTISMMNTCRFALPASSPLEHGAGVNTVDLSRDGQWLMTSATDGSTRIWAVSTGRVVAALEHALNVTRSYFLADEQFVLTTTQDGISRLWDWRGRTMVFEFPKSPDSNTEGVLSRDRRYLSLMAVTENSAQLWDLAARKPLGHPMRVPARIRWTDFSPDSQQIALASADGTVGVWGVSTTRPQVASLKQPGDVTRVRFSPDGKLLAIAWQDKVTLCRANDGSQAREFRGHGGQVLQTEFSPDGRRLVCMAYDSPLKIWDVSSGQLLGQPIEAERPFAYFCMSPDGARLATRSGAGVVRIWDACTGLPLSEPFDHEGSVTDLQFTPDGRLLMTTSQDGTARIWQPQFGSLTGPTFQTTDAQPAACFSRDGGQVYWTSNHAVESFDLQAGVRLGKPMRHDGPIYRIKLSADGKKLATAGWDNVARIWDAEGGEPLTPQLQHRWRLFALAFSPDHRWLATGAAEAIARIWNAETGEPFGPDLVHQGSLTAVEFRPDSRALLTASADATARLWSVETGQPLWPEPLRHKGSVTFAEFNREGGRVVTASADRSARVWDAQKGTPLSRPLLHERGVVTAHFSPDGRWILTCSEDGTARIWDAQSGDAISEPMRHRHKLTDGVFSPDGRLVFTGSRGGEARLWDAHTGYPISEPLLHHGRITCVDFAPDGRQCLSIADSDALRLWNVIEAPVPVPSWLPTLVEAVAGKRLNAKGAVESASREFLQMCRNNCSKSSPQDFYSRWACWFVMDRVREAGTTFRP